MMTRKIFTQTHNNTAPVLAIDPGYDRVGVAILSRKNGIETLFFSECIETDKTQSLHERIHFIGERIKKVIKKFKPDSLAIETLYFTKNQKTAMGVASARGAIIYIAKDFGLSIYEYTPLEVKVAVTGYGKADKKQVLAMVPKIIVLKKEEMLDDEIDSIAIGLTHLAINPGRFRKKIGG